jgi:hypothetical protein
MWSGFDPELWRQLDSIREMVALKHQSPSKEWPLIFVEQHDELLVIREWPNGSLTAYATSEYSERLRNRD